LRQPQFFDIRVKFFKTVSVIHFNVTLSLK